MTHAPLRARMIRALLQAQREGEAEHFHKPALALGPAAHRRNLDGLFRNLDAGAKGRLEAILARREKILDESVVSWQDLYAGEEWEAFCRFEAFCAQVREENGHFRYEDYALPVREFLPGVFLHHHGLPLLQTLNKLGDSAVIDGGCAHGDSVLVFRRYTRGPIHAFEPHPAMHALALRTLEMNAALVGGGVTVEPFALGEASGAHVFMTDNGSSSRIDASLTQGIPARTVSLDDYVAERGLKVGLIKLDIEGHEQRFLRGALRTIKTQKPALVVSIYHSYDDFFRIKPFIEELDCGYAFDFFKGIDASVWASIMLLCEVR